MSFFGVARATPRPRAESPSGFPEDALDIVDGSLVDLGDSGSRHAVFYPTTDARESRPRNLARRLRSGLTGALTSARRFSAGGEIPSTRGFRADWAAGGEPETECSGTCRFGVNSASAV